jgi:hypothetical protein
MNKNSGVHEPSWRSLRERESVCERERERDGQQLRANLICTMFTKKNEKKMYYSQVIMGEDRAIVRPALIRVDISAEFRVELVAQLV